MPDVRSSQLHGKGIFTTITVIDCQPFLWEKHWRRLSENAEKVGIDISEYPERSVTALLAEEIDKNEIKNGRARITFSDESPSKIWGRDDGKKTSLSIIAAERREVPKAFKLTVSPHRVNTTSPLVGIKSSNYLEHLMAADEAKARGFHEAIRLNERDEVSSACMANVFWLKNEKLFTPSLRTGCLAGTTREFVLENFDCSEVETGIEAMQEADTIFLTSAGIGVVAVEEIDGRSLNTEDHKILSLIPKAV